MLMEMEAINNIVIAIGIIGLIPLPMVLIKTYGADVVITATVIAVAIAAWIFN